MNTLQIMICILIFGNSFLAGRQWEKDNENDTHKGVQITLFIIAMIIGGPAFVCFYIWELLKYLFTWFMETTQFNFWRTWYFKKTYDVKPEEQIITGMYGILERYAAKKKLTWAEHHVIYCIYKVFKKHNITIKPHGTN